MRPTQRRFRDVNAGHRAVTSEPLNHATGSAASIQDIGRSGSTIPAIQQGSRNLTHSAVPPVMLFLLEHHFILFEIHQRGAPWAVVTESPRIPGRLRSHALRCPGPARGTAVVKSPRARRAPYALARP